MAEKTQAFLRKSKRPEDLTSKYGIKVKRHPDLPLYQFSYSQIDSPKFKAIVRECRGLVLEDGSWNLVAKPFERFYNFGEYREDCNKFNWDDYDAFTKEDGSLCILYFYDGEWHVNTRGSFGLGQIHPGTDKTWRDAFWWASKLTPVDLKGFEDHTFLFELCTPYNKVVRRYDKPCVFLLGAFFGPDEVTPDNLKVIGLPTPIPDTHHFYSRHDLEQYLLRQEENDPTYEGLVLRDARGVRLKFKTKTYTSMHHLKDNGNILRAKRLVPLVLSGEAEELALYLPEVESALYDCQATIRRVTSEVVELWEKAKDAETQKDFALMVKDHELSGLLFEMRKLYPEDGEYRIRKLIREGSDRMVKSVFKDKTWDFDIEEV